MESTHQLIGRFEGLLDDTTALVTGAGSGIGRACAEAMARAGASVALIGRRLDRLTSTEERIAAAGGRVLTLRVDVRDPGEMEEATKRIEDEFGHVDIAVANAGVNAWADLADLTPSALRDALATNVEGVANTARAVVPAMQRRGHGKFIVVASDNGRRPEPGGSGYVASKFGAVGFALSLSQELYASGVTVHVVEPGGVDTGWYPNEEDAPRDRMLRADDVAYAVLLLATLPGDVVLEEVMILPRALLARPW